MTTYVCDRCAHTWQVPEPPDRCEHCGYAALLVGFDELDVAEEQSETVLARRAAYRVLRAGAGGALGDLDLRAAAQYAQVLGDLGAEHRADDLLASRGRR